MDTEGDEVNHVTVVIHSVVVVLLIILIRRYLGQHNVSVMVPFRTRSESTDSTNTYLPLVLPDSHFTTLELLDSFSILQEC